MSHRGGIDGLARRLASAEPDIVNSGSGGGDTTFDGVARALAAPMSRRRAMAVMGGAVVATALLRPGTASAQCSGPGLRECTSGGKKVCVPDILACCSTDECAIACAYPWRICESAGNCADTDRMCQDYEYGSGGRRQFCSQRVKVVNGCVPSGYSDALRGWCCLPNAACGTEFGTCECANPCDNDCCKANEECVDGKCGPPCPKNQHREGGRCVCDVPCGVNCCKEGQVCIRGSQCGKPKEPEELPGLFDGIKNFFDVANQSSANHGGSRTQSLVAAQAGGPVAAALLGLAAVNAQGVAAGAAFADGRVDRAYKRRVRAAAPRPPVIRPDAGLDPAAAKALSALLAAEAKGFALALACAAALARARGAARAGDLGAARRQVLAAGVFAGKAAKAMRPLPSLRKRAASALRSAGVAEVVATPAQVAALHADVLAGGVPSDLRKQLGRLGVRGRDLGAVREALLLGGAGGPALIAPLADPARARALKAIATELARFSRSARRAPIARTRATPKSARRP